MEKHLDPDRMIRLALTAATRNPALFDCTQESIGLALLTASQLGIEPNGRDGHLIPYGKECQFLPDYKGLIKLAYRNPRVQSFHAAAVHENDEFDYVYGTDSFLRHKPAFIDRGTLVCAYAICKLKDADDQFIVMGKEAVEKRRAVAKTKKIWDAWEDEMWAKTAVHALSKLIPLGGHFEKAVEYDNNREAGDPLEVEFTNLVAPEDDPGKSTSDKLADRLKGDNGEPKDEPSKSTYQLFKEDMEAAPNLEALEKVKAAALAESQAGDSVDMDEWQSLFELYGELKKSFEKSDSGAA